VYAFFIPSLSFNCTYETYAIYMSQLIYFCPKAQLQKRIILCPCPFPHLFPHYLERRGPLKVKSVWAPSVSEKWGNRGAKSGALYQCSYINEQIALPCLNSCNKVLSFIGPNQLLDNRNKYHK
jgi:hypothetical protein